MNTQYYLEFRRVGKRNWHIYAPYPKGARPTSTAIRRLKRQIVKDETTYYKNGRVATPDMEFRLAKRTTATSYEKV